MAALLNSVKVATATTGTGTVTLGAAETGHLTVAEAGGVDATVYGYRIDDGSDFEIGQGTYTSSGTTLSRDTVTVSKISGTAGTSKLNLTGSATVTIVARVVDLVGPATTDTLTNKTLVAPALGTPASGTLTNCTGLPVAGIAASTSSAIGVGSVELGHASDTTIARVSAGRVSVEGSTISKVTISDSAPGSPLAGDMWFDSTDGSLNVYYTDTDTSQWVTISRSGVAYVTESIIATGTISASSSFDITDLPTTYRSLKILLSDITVSSDGTRLDLRFSSNNGSTFQATAYQYTVTGRDSGAVGVTTDSDSGTELRLFPSGTTAGAAGIGSASTESGSFTILLHNYASATLDTLADWSGTYVDATGTASTVTIRGGGSRAGSGDTDAIRFIPSAGTFSASYIVIGVK